MANSEADFKREFINGVKIKGGHATLISAENNVGVPDMSVKLPTLPHVWLEAKFERVGGSKSYLTPKQGTWMRSHLNARGDAGWVKCIKVNLREWHIYAGSYSELEQLESRRYKPILEGNLIQVRGAGMSLDVHSIVTRVLERANAYVMKIYNKR